MAERDLITALGAEHDIVLSCEGSPQDESVRLATSGVQMAVLTVKGRASHAGSAPEQGRNARLRAGAPAAADARPVGSRPKP